MTLHASKMIFLLKQTFAFYKVSLKIFLFFFLLFFVIFVIFIVNDLSFCKHAQTHNACFSTECSKERDPSLLIFIC